MKKSSGISQIARNATGGKISMMVRSGQVSEYASSTPKIAPEAPSVGYWSVVPSSAAEQHRSNTA